MCKISVSALARVACFTDLLFPYIIYDGIAKFTSTCHGGRVKGVCPGRRGQTQWCLIGQPPHRGPKLPPSVETANPFSVTSTTTRLLLHSALPLSHHRQPQWGLQHQKAPAPPAHQSASIPPASQPLPTELPLLRKLHTHHPPRTLLFRQCRLRAQPNSKVRTYCTRLSSFFLKSN